MFCFTFIPVVVWGIFPSFMEFCSADDGSFFSKDIF